MLLPKLSEVKKQTTLTDRFYGYQHVEAPTEGGFYDDENISTARFPVLTPRLPRRKVRELAEPGGLFAKEKLAWVDGTKLYYDGEAVADVTAGPKSFSSLGAWLIVWPDGVRYNTHDGTVDVLAQKNVSSGTVTFTLSMQDGQPYENVVAGETPPEDTTKFWLSTGESPHVLKKYNPATKLWNSIPSTFVRIEAPGIGHGLKDGDTVTISGVTGAEADEFNRDMIVWKADEDWILVTGILDTTFSQTEAVTVERKIPTLDYVTECDNRIWGCSSETNEIFACKLGDPTNWYSYEGLAGDSYAATVGSDGPFTGAASHNGYVLFFKSGCIHKIYGTKPANFQITQVAAPGVQQGSERSLQQIGGILYYKAEHAVMAYDGSLPEEIGRSLGPVHYDHAVGGVCRGRYYLCMTNLAGERNLFCYDPATELWAREDGADAVAFAQAGGGGYFLDAGGVLWELSPHEAVERTAQEPLAQEETDGPVSWWAETGILDLYELNAHYHNRLQLRLWLAVGSTFGLDVSYDGGDWELVREITGNDETAFGAQSAAGIAAEAGAASAGSAGIDGAGSSGSGAGAGRAVSAASVRSAAGTMGKSVFMSVQLRRCDSARIRLRGVGPCRVYAMSRVTKTGQEVRLYDRE